MTAARDGSSSPTPVTLDLCVALLTLLIGWLSLTLKTRLGLDIVARHRETLHSVIMSGLHAAANHDLSPQETVEAAIDYARRSVPEAITALCAPDSILRQLAEAKAAVAKASKARAISSRQMT